MNRAAVIIGVNKVGHLQPLQAAVDSAKAMERWAQSQRFDAVKLLTDETKPLTAQDVKTAIKEIIDTKTCEQLVVYFSGHGVNLRYSEYWLLSDAPADTQAAVNVDGSIVLARQAGIPHVVLISDACRTAADGIQAQQITGSEIFPNNPIGGPEKKVDFFFATTLGAPALEIKDVADSVNRFKALYTDALVDGLSGRSTDCVEIGGGEGKRVGFVRPWPLRYYLDAEVPRRLQRAQIGVSVFQTPDARITSPPNAWLSMIPGFAALAAAQPIAPQPLPPEVFLEPPLPGDPPPEPPFEMLLHQRVAAIESSGIQAETARNDADTVRSTARAHAEVFGRLHFESRCGFKIQGTTFSAAFHPSQQVHIDGPDSVRVDIGHPASVLLEFGEGTGVLLPAIPEFVTALTMRDGELINVVYEPSDTSPRWYDYSRRIDQMRRLRGQIAAAAHYGVFRLEGPNALHIARNMQTAKGFDPTMALYAAYAYNDLQETDRIKQMQDFLYRDLGIRLFDTALLSGRLTHTQVIAADDVFPSMPMLSQGWSLLNAYQVSSLGQLNQLAQYVHPSSLWTLLEQSGVRLVRAALHAGEMK